MKTWLGWFLQVIVIISIVAMISMGVNLIIEMRLLQIRMDRLGPVLDKSPYNQI